MRTRTALVSLLAIALLAWFLRHANLADVWAQVRRARVDYLFFAFLFVGVTYWVRAWRWQFLLAPLGPTRFRTAFRTTVIGFAALSLLPARAGDLLRPYLLARQENLPVPATFATIVMERVLDLVAVVALLALFVWGYADDATLSGSLRRSVEISAAFAAGAAVALLALMWVLATHPERIGTIVFSAARVLPRRMAHTLSAVASTFSSGFAVARRPGTFVAALICSFPLWLAISAEAYFVTRAFGIDMSYPGSFLLQALLVIGVAVPTPGAVGSFHEAYRIGVTTFFHAPNDAAVAAAIVVHAVSFIPVVLVGMIFMMQDGLSVGRLQALAGTAREKELPDTDEMPVLRPPRR